MKQLLGELWSRRVPHVLGLYIGAAWGAVNFIDWMSERASLSPVWSALALVVLMALLPSVALLAWTRARPGPQAFSRLERVFVPCNVAAMAVVAGLFVQRADVNLGRPTELSADRRQLTYLGSALDPHFSPDGSQVAFLSRDSTTTSVIRLSLDSPLRLDTLVERPNGQLSALSWNEASGLTAYDGSLTVTIDEESGVLAMVSRYFSYARSLLGWTAEMKREGRVVDLTRRGVEGLAQQIALPGEGDGIWTTDIAWSPTAPTLAVSRVTEEGGRVDLLNAETGTVWTVLEGSDYDLRSVAWSADGETLFFVENDDLVAVTTAADDGAPLGEPEALFTVSSGLMALTPDGRQLVEQESTVRASVRLFSLAGLAPDGYSSGRALRTSSSTKGAISLSADGRLVALRDGAADSVLQVIDIEDGSVQSIRLDAGAAQTAWSSDGEQVAVTLLGARRVLTRVRIDTEHVDTLAMTVSTGVTWCGSGTIVYQQPSNEDYYVLDTGSGNSRELFGERSRGWMFDPVCSPDGEHIAFRYTRRGDAPSGIWIVSHDGATEHVALPISQSRVLASPLGWSVDGPWLYYHRSSPPRGVYRVPPLGGEPELVLSLPAHVTQVAMSRDASALVTVESETFSDLWIHRDFKAGR